MSIPTITTLPVPPTTPSTISRHVAVIGAGAAGLVAARELRREGHKVVVYERDDQVGGTWNYTPKVESDLLGLDPNRSLIHSSLYQSLRTNLPREVMGFLDYPFVARVEKGRDQRRFPGHKEVLMYLKEFERAFGVGELVRFETEVVFVGLEDFGRWKVRSRSRGGEVCQEEIFDAVVICNGHHSKPNLPVIPGIDAWPGKQMHSHNYRVPNPFRGQVVALIGSAASAADISRDIAQVAKQVHIAARSVTEGAIGKLPGHDNIWQHPMIETVHEDGSVVFQDRSIVFADIIVHCTGYKYHFPFLETNGIVNVEDNCVGPLYKHVFPPALAPSLSFVGLPWKVVPFPLVELQSKWIAGILSNKLELPSTEEMIKDVEAFYLKLESLSRPKRYTHNIGDHQFDYDDWLASQCGYRLIEQWRKEMYSMTSKNRQDRPETYRDEWDDHDLLVPAYEDFKQHI